MAACDCILGRAGFLSAYWLGLAVSGLFAAFAVATAWFAHKAGQFKDIEQVKDRMLEIVQAQEEAPQSSVER